MLSIFREKLKLKVTPGQGTIAERFISMGRGRAVPLSWVVLFSTWVIPSLPGRVRQGGVRKYQAVQLVIKPLLCLHVS